jgi:hypothetical protein
MLSIEFARFGSRGALELMQYKWLGTPPTLQNLIYGMLKPCFVQIVDMVKQTPTYKNKMKTLKLEHSQARTNKKKGSKNKIRLVLFELHMKKKMPPKRRVLHL